MQVDTLVSWDASNDEGVVLMEDRRQRYVRGSDIVKYRDHLKIGSLLTFRYCQATGAVTEAKVI
jgi:hypothetical protein